VDCWAAGRPRRRHWRSRKDTTKWGSPRRRRPAIVALMTPSPGEPDVIRVLIVDDHPLVRAGVLGVFNGADDIQVVGECEDGTQVPNTASSVLPHVVLMDVRMPAKSGMEATRDLLACHPSVRVVMLTGSLTRGSLREAMQAGAVGYLLKGGPPNELVNAVRAVAAGGTAWPSGDAAPHAGPSWR